MRAPLVVSAAIAVALHGALLFGLDLDEPAVPLPPAPSPIVVGLVASAPAPGPSAPAAGAATPAAPPREPDPAPPASAVPPPAPPPRPGPERQVRRPTRRPPATLEAPPPAAASPAAAPSPGTAGAGGAGAPGASDTPAAGGGASGGPLASALPRYRRTPPPAYPPAARRARHEGVSLLSVEVGANGRPTKVTLKRSSGFDSLDRAALAAVRRWTFEPARSAGVPVASHVEVPVRFDLADPH